MIGIPLMFMCLTYTGDLLADAFISGYSKIINFAYRQLCRGGLKSCLPDETRRSFEQSDVRIYLILSSFWFIFDSVGSLRLFSLLSKKLDMYLLLQH